MKIFYSIVLLISLSLSAESLYAQGTLTIDEQWQGDWVAQDTGIRITPEHITRLYNVEGNWEPSSFAGKEFYFLDSPVVFKGKVVEGWIFSSYTAMRFYHKNEGGGETTKEAVEYKAVRLELIGDNTLQLSVSKTFRTIQENKRPAVRLTSAMFAELAKNDYLSTRVFKRMKNK